MSLWFYTGWEYLGEVVDVQLYVHGMGAVKTFFY